MMTDIFDLDKYRQEKETKEEESSELEGGIRELPEEEFQDFLDYGMRLDFENYNIYNDEFIQENAEHLVNKTIPHCVVCKEQLIEGDKVDSMWPLEYGNNICQKCEGKLNDDFDNQKIVNLADLELILVEKDYKKIMNKLNNKEILKIKGFKIITEKKYQQVKYEILEVEEELKW